MKDFLDYRWKNGVPIGVNANHSKDQNDKKYRIVSDPYHKWISIEQYAKGTYTKTVYDSLLLDFRTVNPRNQTAWQKITLSESKEKVISLIRDHNDRALFIENYHFKENRCYQCDTSSVHGLLLSVQKMYYQELEDPFNGVILFDANDHPVMYKKYELDKAINDFGILIEESWDVTLTDSLQF